MADQADVGAPANAPIVNNPTECLQRRAAYLTCDMSCAEIVGPLYYFAPEERAPGPYREQRAVKAIIDVASDGTLAGVELVHDNRPPPPFDAQVTIGAPPPAVGQLEAQVQILRKALEEIDKRCTVSSCICCRDVTDIAREALTRSSLTSQGESDA